MTRLRYLLLGSVACIATTAIAYPILEPGTGAVQGSGYPGWGADIAVTVTAASTTSGLTSLTPGFYALACSGTVFADQGTTGVAATTSERRIPGGYVYPVRVEGSWNSDDYIALISTGGVPSACVLSRDRYR